MLDIKRVLASRPRPPEDVELAQLLTPWGEKIAAGEKDLPPASHPRPQLRRDSWVSLNGRSAVFLFLCCQSLWNISV